MIAFALLVAGCASAGMRNYTPVSEKTSYPPEDLLYAARAELDASGHDVVRMEPGEFWLQTREQEVAVSSVPRMSYKYAFKVTTAGGTLSISASCKQNSSTDRTKFEECGKERPKAVIEEQKRLKDAILTRAKSEEKEAASSKASEGSEGSTESSEKTEKSEKSEKTEKGEKTEKKGEEKSKEPEKTGTKKPAKSAEKPKE
jgi:hypothetical protein